MTAATEKTKSEIMSETTGIPPESCQCGCGKEVKPNRYTSPDSVAASIHDDLRRERLIGRCFLKDTGNGGDLRIHTANACHLWKFGEWAIAAVETVKLEHCGGEMLSPFVAEIEAVIITSGEEDANVVRTLLQQNQPRLLNSLIEVAGKLGRYQGEFRFVETVPTVSDEQDEKNGNVVLARFRNDWRTKRSYSTDDVSRPYRSIQLFVFCKCGKPATRRDAETGVFSCDSCSAASDAWWSGDVFAINQVSRDPAYSHAGRTRDRIVKEHGGEV